MSILIALAAAAQAPAPVAPPTAAARPTDAQTVARMAAMYDEACLRAFPSDTALGALMAQERAAPLSEADVRVSLRDDPGRGWLANVDGSEMIVLLELPPYHACSVRALTGGPGADTDLGPYRAAVAAYKATHKGFSTQPAMDMTQGGIRIHGEVEAREQPHGGGELLMLIDQQVVDRSQLTPGTTGTPLRFVHQIKQSQQ